MMSISPLFGQSLPTVQLVDISIYHSSQSFARNLQGRPRATDGTWHVSQIKNEQSMGVGSVAGQTHALATTAGGDICGINTDIGSITARIDQPSTFGSALIDISNVSVSGVRTLRRNVRRQFICMTHVGERFIR